MTNENSSETVNLKQTLNLPFTEFPMKASLAQREPEMLARWQKLDIYQRIADKNIGNSSCTTALPMQTVSCTLATRLINR